MNPISHLLRLFFHLLYHSFAWAYDLVAWTVSLGHWKDWVESVVPFIEGTRTLELGHGPGHLQRILLDRSLLLFGLDESRQMGRLAKNNLLRSGYAQPSLIRGLGQELPFPNAFFDTIIATFPAEYIFEAQTLSELRRTLIIGGRLIVLPVAWVTGKGPLDRFAAWLFQVTGQAPSEIDNRSIAQLTKPFVTAGFQVETKVLEVKSSCVLIVLAKSTE